MRHSFSSSCLNTPHIQTLPNGLTLIAEQVPVPAVSLQLWCRIGSRHESDRLNGAAHFLEHLVFKGTPSLPSGEFERRIEACGAMTNAATSQDYTQFFTTCAPADFSRLAPLQFDVVLNPVINADAFVREREVVLEEIRRSHDSPQRRIFNRLTRVAFPKTPYARPVLGTQETISALNPQDMRDFHAHWYQPTALTAVVVGDRPVAELIETVADSFAQCYRIKTPCQKLMSPPCPPLPPFPEVITQTIHDPQLQQARLILMWRVPGLDQFAKTLPLSVIAVILGQGRISRLFRELREERGLVRSIRASNLVQAQQGLFYVSTQLPSENLPKVEATIQSHIQRLQQEPLTSTELATIRTQVANRFIFSSERPGDRANLYGYYYSQLGRVEDALSYVEQIQSLTAADIQTAAQAYLDPDAYGRITAIPD